MKFLYPQTKPTIYISHVFIKFDTAEFYPCISETVLRTAICFAEDHVEFTDEEKRIIFDC